MTKTFLGAALLGAAQVVLAHGGGLDAEGCHHNRRTGDYHCHRAPAMPAYGARHPAALDLSPAAAVEAAPRRALAQPPGGSTCHVGPRGGTYTITPSGRKNYGGC